MALQGTSLPNLIHSETFLDFSVVTPPSAELDYWKQRMTKFNSVLTAISTRRVKLVHATLVANKSKLIGQWAELDRRVSDQANEARDNVKYLSTLDQYLGPLQTSDPVAMKELLPNLINSIRMIHTISRYYNTSERMTSLFVKVTNQMIKSCRAFIMQVLMQSLKIY